MHTGLYCLNYSHLNLDGGVISGFSKSAWAHVCSTGNVIKYTLLNIKSLQQKCKFFYWAVVILEPPPSNKSAIMYV